MKFKNEKGQAMVEFALVLPVLLLLLGGIIDFGWVFGNFVIANNASREAARYAAIHMNDADYSATDAQAEALARIPNVMVPNITKNEPAKVVINGENAVIYTVVIKTEVFMPFYSQLINPFYAKGETTMKIE